MFWNILERPLSFQKIPQYSFDIKKKFLEDSTSFQVFPDFSVKEQFEISRKFWSKQPVYVQYLGH